MQDMNCLEGHRILIIDDNPAIHDDFRKILLSDQAPSEFEDAEDAFFGTSKSVGQVAQLQLETAGQGQEGVQKVRDALAVNRPFAIAFVDMRMPPGWDGLTTIEHLWKLDPKLQIIICTAYSDNSWSDICQRLGYSDRLLILKKPFDNSEVRQLVLALTQKWTLARRVASRMEQLEQSIVDRNSKLDDVHRETDMLLEAISSILIGVDQHGCVRRWNSSATELFGVSAAEAVGKPLSTIDIEWVDPEATARFFNTHTERAITRRVFKLTRNGAIRVLGMSSYPVTHQGEHRGVLYLGTDITKQSQLEQQLQQAQKLESVGQLAAGVAHEINTPMQYLGDNLDFVYNKMKHLEPLVDNLNRLAAQLDEEHDPAVLLQEINMQLKKLKVNSLMQQIHEAISDSLSGVQHVSRIVRAMKEFAHPGQEQATPVDINRALESTIAVTTNEWKYVADIETHLDPTLPLVPAWAGELNQAFLNILVNAAHATADVYKDCKGTITISTERADNFVQVSITDSGSGIPAEIRHRVFDPFFTTKEIGKGTGQGLAIAHAVIVQKHGGKIWFDSTPSVGTTFYIQLPIEASNSRIQSPKPVAIAAS